MTKLSNLTSQFAAVASALALSLVLISGTVSVPVQAAHSYVAALA